MISDRVKKGNQKTNSRALMKAAGLTQTEIDRPFIGVAGSWTNIFPGHNHLDKISQAAADGIRIAGGTPVMFDTIAICDSLPMGNSGMCYSLPSRELIANSIETIAQAHGLDGLVLVASCDKIIPGMLQGAMRINIPAIMVTGGPMLAGKLHGKRIDLRSSAEAVGMYESGRITKEEFEAIEEENCPGCGSCKGMFTANSMACMAEAIGLALPWGGTIPAVHAKRMRLAKESGMKIMELVEKDLKPSDIVTEKALKNAMTADMMLGCSTNTTLHLPAIVGGLGLKLELDDFDAVSRTTAQVVKLCPAGHHTMEDFDDAGGMPALLNLGIKANLIDGTVMTVTGKTLRENVAGSPVYNDDVIRSIDNPYSVEGGLMVLHGNLAPGSAVVKSSGVPEAARFFQGPAQVFNSERDAMNALTGGKVKDGSVIVIRYEGPKGGPGMQEMLAVTGYICGSDRGEKVALVTDGRFSGGSRGCVVGHISPEAAQGGPIALVEEGDQIRIDLNHRSIQLLVDEGELARRRKSWSAPAPKVTRGWLAQYAALVGETNTGAQLP